ncbi:hypothetical protein VNO77_27261 [Canavalia gladiata]|uniref:Uncharacterized protein n=1 Tax=Canavalia gladiata TaxID=3824 RepID=A0AAN9KTU0_CANGL
MFYEDPPEWLMVTGSAFLIIMGRQAEMEKSESQELGKSWLFPLDPKWQERPNSEATQLGSANTAPEFRDRWAITPQASIRHNCQPSTGPS